jgi:hypothetical protein
LKLRTQLQQATAAREQAEAALGEAREAMQEFVDRCERGEVRSRYTYGKFKHFLQSPAAKAGERWRAMGNDKLEKLLQASAQLISWIIILKQKGLMIIEDDNNCRILEDRIEELDRLIGVFDGDREFMVEVRWKGWGASD